MLKAFCGLIKRHCRFQPQLLPTLWEALVIDRQATAQHAAAAFAHPLEGASDSLTSNGPTRNRTTKLWANGVAGRGVAGENVAGGGVAGGGVAGGGVAGGGEEKPGE